MLFLLPSSASNKSMSLSIALVQNLLDVNLVRVKTDIYLKREKNIKKSVLWDQVTRGYLRNCVAFPSGRVRSGRGGVTQGRVSPEWKTPAGGTSRYCGYALSAPAPPLVLRNNDIFTCFNTGPCFINYAL